MTVNIGVLWDDEVNHEGDSPMNKNNRNERYSVFSELAAGEGGAVFLANYQKYEAGTLTEAYRWTGNKWKKEQDVELDVVFDKFKFDQDTRKLKKEMGDRLPVLNGFELEELCKDKLLTYEKFPEHVPETCFAEEEKVEDFLQKDSRAVLKPRFGFGGKGVSVIDAGEDFERYSNLLVQRYIEPSKTLPHIDFEGAHDFRVVLVNGDVSASYYRLNEDGDRANSSYGAEKHFIDIEEIPDSVRGIVDEVNSELEVLEPSVYSVDFMFDREGQPWIIELNSKPGLGVASEAEKEHRLPVMQKVVETLVKMAQS